MNQTASDPKNDAQAPLPPQPPQSGDGNPSGQAGDPAAGEAGKDESVAELPQDIIKPVDSAPSPSSRAPQSSPAAPPAPPPPDSATAPPATSPSVSSRSESASPKSAPPPPPPPPPAATKGGFIARLVSKIKIPLRRKPEPAPASATSPAVGQAGQASSPAPALPGQAEQVVGKAAVIKRAPSRVILTLKILALTLVALLAVFFIFFYRAQINISPNPTPDEILLDGARVQSGLHKVAPGPHAIEIKKDGYISFHLEKEFKINERLNLAFALKRATPAELVHAGGADIQASVSGRAIYFQDAEGRLATTRSEPLADEFKSFVLTISAFPDAKKIIYSDDDKFVIVQTPSAIRRISLLRLDAVSQWEEEIESIGARQVGTLTMNRGHSDYVATANSKIIYDRRDGENWDLMELDTTTSVKSILVGLETARFSDFHLDWSYHPKKLLLCGGRLGILDLGTRHYDEFDENIDFRFCQWGPKGEYAVASDASGQSYLVRDNMTVEKLGIVSASELVSWVSPSKAIFISEGRPIQVDFDKGTRINYAEVEGLDAARSAVVARGRIFFADSEGVKTAPLTEGVYREARSARAPADR